MTFSRRRNHVTTHFSERIPVVKRRVTAYVRETLGSISRDESANDT